jgi:hypothetical protein
MIIENKPLNKFQYFVQRHFKNTIPEHFPKEGSWITLELIDTSNSAKVLIPAMLSVVNQRELQVKTRLPFPKNCSKDGTLYCTFDQSHSEKKVFQSGNTGRYLTGFEIVGMVSKTAEIKLIDSIFKKANQREFERLPYKRNYNISIHPQKIPETSDVSVKYNKIVKNFIENLNIKDIAPGGLGATCKKKCARIIQAKHKIQVNICFGQRMEYRFYKKLITSKTVRKIIKTNLTVIKKIDTDNGEFIFGFKFKDVEKHRYYILDESNRIRQSEAALTASGVQEF